MHVKHRLPVLLYGCEAWFLTLTEERRLKVFENRIVKRIFGLKRSPMGSGEGSTMRNFIVCTVQIKLLSENKHNWCLCKIWNLYHSLNIVRVIKSRRWRWVGYLARMVEARSAFKNVNKYSYRKETIRVNAH